MLSKARENIRFTIVLSKPSSSTRVSREVKVSSSTIVKVFCVRQYLILHDTRL